MLLSSQQKQKLLDPTRLCSRWQKARDILDRLNINFRHSLTFFEIFQLFPILSGISRQRPSDSTSLSAVGIVKISLKQPIRLPSTLHHKIFKVLSTWFPTLSDYFRHLPDNFRHISDHFRDFSDSIFTTSKMLENSRVEVWGDLEWSEKAWRLK